jgi:hypothetical protein
MNRTPVAVGHLARNRTGTALVIAIAVGAVVVGLFVQPRPAGAATTPIGPAITVSVSGTQYSEIYGNLNPGSVTLTATKGTPIQIDTDYMGDTVTSCRLTLSSSSRGGTFFDQTSPAGSTKCPTPKPFKVAGSPGTVQFFVLQEAVTYTDSSGTNSVTNVGLLQIATAAW